MNVNLMRKVKLTYSKYGLKKTIIKVIKYPVNHLKIKRFTKKMVRFYDNEDRWTWAWTSNSWRKDESVSGDGSSLEYTENLRRELPHLFKKFSIKTIFDAPCGDLNWMGEMLPLSSIEYKGGDIVKPLVDELDQKFGCPNVSFIHFDLIKMVPPKCDLMICRDCIIHFSYSDTRAMLENFLLSGSKYLLTTTHTNTEGQFTNTNILNGAFHMVDLFSEPYNFPRKPLFIIQDWIPPHPERQMCLWDREQIHSAIFG